MRFEIDQPTCPRHRRVVRRRALETDTKKVAQGERVAGAPRDPTLRLETLAVANQEQPEVDAWWQARPTSSVSAWAQLVVSTAAPRIASNLMRIPPHSKRACNLRVLN